jgi:hypothetical protein
MGRRQERLRAKRGYAKLDNRCPYCGNDQPGTLQHPGILGTGVTTCRDKLACQQRREARDAESGV